MEIAYSFGALSVLVFLRKPNLFGPNLELRPAGAQYGGHVVNYAPRHTVSATRHAVPVTVPSGAWPLICHGAWQWAHGLSLGVHFFSRKNMQIAIASNQPNSYSLQPTSDGLQPTSDGLQPTSDGLQATCAVEVWEACQGRFLEGNIFSEVPQFRPQSAERLLTAILPTPSTCAIDTCPSHRLQRQKRRLFIGSAPRTFESAPEWWSFRSAAADGL